MRNQQDTFFVFHSVRGVIMVWVGISFKDKTELYFVESTLKEERTWIYCKTSTVLFLHLTWSGVTGFYLYARKCGFAHRSIFYFTVEGYEMAKLPWPALSPDLNSSKNLCFLSSIKLYDKWRQFNSVAKLTLLVLKNWDNVSTDTISSPLQNMKLAQCVLSILIFFVKCVLFCVFRTYLS